MCRDFARHSAWKVCVGGSRRAGTGRRDHEWGRVTLVTRATERSARREMDLMNLSKVGAGGAF
jgi:hypothetical protein